MDGSSAQDETEGPTSFLDSWKALDLLLFSAIYTTSIF
ncbi:hypothetical protein NC652_022125 [Populus alba x Populus x berolinensis]|nr:hypothetical protein NC651_021307 [Populus alba x Populus x berolinensis]KAJ6904134.1 hypothetical protein NC651_021316 [Populus alba x Populus x berolinensis]KAJ6911746.1 hypothetical protein NC652_022125 [Populus alba x Populus x berolinensis]